jgi:hypothetical protein
VLVEAWVPACAGMARKSNSRIVTMFVEANWVTASSAGVTESSVAALVHRRLVKLVNGSER